MTKISNNIKEFNRALREEKGLRVTSEGDFYVTYTFSAFFRHVLGLDRFHWMAVSRGLRIALREIESVPVNINISKTHAVQAYDFHEFFEACEIVLEKLEGFESKRVKEEIFLLKRELTALLYRVEEANGGLGLAEISSHQLQSLFEAAQVWKSSQAVFHNSLLTHDDIIILQKMCHYREFATLILSNKKFLEQFFKWALRDRISIQTFIEFPSITQKINDFDLNGRIGRMGGNLLKVQYIPQDAEGFCKKVVTLPFEGKDISILDEKRYVLLRGSYALTIREVFEEFRKKRVGASNLEFMAEGIINWNSFLWGWWDQKIHGYHLVDFNEKEWWKQLPVLEMLSLREAREKFGNHLDGRQWNVAAIATRERSTLDFEGAHAYSSIAIPQQNGNYVVYPFGKFSITFPENLLKALLNIGHTAEATVAYPDENVYYTHRQRSRYSFALTEEQGLAYMESIKNDMLLSRAKNFVYQIESENCAKWAHDKIENVVGPHRIPNVFQMPFLNSEPHGLMERIFAGVKFFPENLQVRITLIIHFFLGGYKGLWIWEEGKRVWKSLTHHAFWNDTVIYHPSMLHRQQELGLIGRAVTQGVTFTKEHIRMSYHNLHHKMVIFGKCVYRAISKELRTLIAIFENHLPSQGGLFVAGGRNSLSFAMLSVHENEVQGEAQGIKEKRTISRKSGIENALTKSLVRNYNLIGACAMSRARISLYMAKIQIYI